MARKPHTSTPATNNWRALADQTRRGPLRTYLLHFLRIDFLLFDLVRFLLTHRRTQPPAAAFIGADVLGIVFAIAIAIAIANVSWRRFRKPLVQRGHAYNY